LARLFRDNHVLVPGFSGDLRFGEDYLALPAVPEHSAEVTCLYRLPTARRGAADPRTCRRPAAGKLPDFFRLLGIAIEASPEEQDARVEANRLANARVSDWIRETNAGPLPAAIFCLILLRTTGQHSAAMALANTLAKHVQAAGDFHTELVALTVHNLPY
jgi:hypothetical protein